MVTVFQANDCVVCLEQYTDTNYPACLPCGHTICIRCSQRVSNLCPIDRQGFAEAEVRRIFNNGEEETADQKLQSVAESLRELTQRNAELIAHQTELENRNAQLEARNQQLKARMNRIKRKNVRLRKRTKPEVIVRLVEKERYAIDEEGNIITETYLSKEEVRMAKKKRFTVDNEGNMINESYWSEEVVSAT